MHSNIVRKGIAQQSERYQGDEGMLFMQHASHFELLHTSNMLHHLSANVIKIGRASLSENFQAYINN